MTERSLIEDMDLTSLVDAQTFDEVYEGASTHAPGVLTGSPEIEDDPVGAGNAAVSPDPEVVTLRNIQSPEQSFGIHEDGVYTGKMVGFIEGVLITDRDTANRILAVAPHVYEEPREGPVFEHPETKFRTRSPQAFSEYTIRRGQAMA